MIKTILQGFRHLPICMVLLCWVGFTSCSALAATPLSVLDRLKIPEGANVQIVTSHSVSNGMPVAIATLHSTEPIGSVFKFYRQLWASGKTESQPEFVESELPGWSLISRLREGFNIVIQLNNSKDSGSAGFISVMAVDRPIVKENRGEFYDLKQLSSNRSVDGVDTSLMQVYASSSSVSHTHQIYRQRLTRRGWQVLSDSDVDDAWVMILVRDQSRLEISIVPSGDYGSVLVAHQVTSE